MDVGDVIIDISSDEESLADESFDITEEWLNELLESVDIEVPDHLDDVMVVDELSAPSCMKNPILLQKDSDEDCLILDGDPDNVASGKSESVDGCADLLIVGEKGHLACRDYPHPRHLCVNFPFSTTPHEMHCKLCHCYVCDSLAPCTYWGYGFSMTDHCHASEKEQTWKSLRNYFKLVPDPPKLPGSRHSSTQPSRSFQDFNHPFPVLSNTLPESSTSILDPSIHRENQLLNSHHSGLRTLPVNQGTRHLVGSQSFPRSHLYSRERSNSSQPSRTFSPLARSESMRPEVSNDMAMIQDMLAFMEADLLGTDYNIGSMDGSNMQSDSSLYPALAKPSVIGEAQARI